MKKCLQGRILPSQYLWKIFSLYIQEQVAMSHTGSRKKTWMILHEVCICQNSSQSSWLLGLNSGTQFQELEQIRSLVFLWVCKQASQSTVIFSVSGIVELYSSITGRKTGGLEALLFLVSTAQRESSGGHE